MNAYDSSAYVQKVWRSFGISKTDIANLPTTAVAGKVTATGNVYVDGQSRPVATGALTGGRENIKGSTAVTVEGITFYKRPPSVSFQQNSLPAFVSMADGKFQFAIIASCGNAVSATAVVHQPAPAPAPAPAAPTAPPAPTPPPAAPTQTQTQVQNQEVTVQQPPTPAPAALQPKPQALPNTGPGSVAGMFGLTSVLGWLGYRKFLLHRLSL
jgi:hypothetical protein